MKASKGSAFERDFSKNFSLYVSGGKRDDIFWRSSQSGGRATTRAKTGKTTEGSYGDITCLDSDYSFITETLCFELKRGYNNVNIQDLLDSNKKKPEIIKFWEQNNKDKELGGRIFSVVVLKRDYKKPLIFLDRAFYKEMNYRCEMIRPLIIVKYSSGVAFTVLPLDNFFKIPRDIFLTIAKIFHKGV